MKVAATCANLRETRELLAQARSRQDVVAIPMGDTGDGSRLLALREGSALAYAAVDAATAPGQLSLDAMHRVYQLNRRFGAGSAGPTLKTRVWRDWRSDRSFALPSDAQRGVRVAGWMRSICHFACGTLRICSGRARLCNLGL